MSPTLSRVRRLLWPIVAVLVTAAAIAPFATAGTDLAPISVDRTQVTDLGASAACEPGHVGGYVPALSSVVCTHAVPDPMSSVVAAGPAKDAPFERARCYGNGINGNRIQLIYAYIEGNPNRMNVVRDKIFNQYVPRMEGTFRTTSREQGREVGMRLHAPGCKLSLDAVQIDSDSADPSDSSQFYAVVNAIAAEGYDDVDRKYMVWYDGPSFGACGTATAQVFPILPLSPFDNPTPLNPNNVGQTPLSPSYAIAWGAPYKAIPNGITPCWGDGAMGALTEAHELLHALGAVQLSAPNSNGFGHCRDENDIMCYPEGGITTFKRCSSRVELLDCGQDDYFAARAPIGTYLSTHWNIANSSFLGEATGLDSVPLEIPRP